MHAPKYGLLAPLTFLVAMGCGAAPDGAQDGEWVENLNDVGAIDDQADALVMKAASYQPDLAIDIDVESTCAFGDAYVYFWVENLDRGYAAPSVVAFRYGPAGSTYLTRNSYVAVPGIRPYGHEHVKVNIRTQPRVQVTADTFDDLDESNESNNTAYLDCNRVLRLPELEMRLR